MEFLQGLLHSCSRRGVFLQLPHLLARAQRPDEAPSRRGECEPAVLSGACYRLLLLARHQAGHLWPGPGPLRTLWAELQAPQPGMVPPGLGVFAQGFSHQPLRWPPRW